MAGVSRRHLAALEKGANVSVLVLRKVAAVLDLHEIELGEGMSVVTGSRDGTNVNLPLLADAIREAHAGTIRAEAMLARATGLLGVSGVALPEPARNGSEVPHRLNSHFPTAPIFLSGHADPAGFVRDGDWIEVELWGDMAQGQPVDESVRGERVLVPAGLYAKNERVFRVRGDSFLPLAIRDGDLLITELRTRGKAATAELVVGKIDDIIWIGRLWQKNGHRTLMTDGLVELPLGQKKEALKIMAVINQIVRPETQ
jgi:SOS-response transcriptional repressor LexA